VADDARISTALPRHPKTVKLQRRLGAPGCWSLLCLFLWVAENRPTGDLEGMSVEDIEIAANWPGDPGDFVRTLAEVRFLDGQEGAYKIHDWAEHNPWAATRPQRTEAAKKAAAARWKSKQVAVEPDAQRMRPACDSHETAMPSSPLLSSPHLTTVKQARMRAAFAQPTLEQVSQYCQERRNTVDPEVWLNHYTSNGWKVGRTSMKDWKAAVRTWEQNGVNHANGSGNRAEQRQANNLAARERVRASIMAGG
jgi:hypothetical protein